MTPNPPWDMQRAVPEEAMRIPFDVSASRAEAVRRKPDRLQLLENQLRRAERPGDRTSLRREARALRRKWKADICEATELGKRKAHCMSTMEVAGRETHDRSKWRKEITRYCTQKYHDEGETQDVVRARIDALRAEAGAPPQIEVSMLMAARARLVTGKAPGRTT